MFRLVLFSAFLTISLGASPKTRPIVPMLDGRIVGGQDTNIESYPHQISLQYSGGHICGGSVLSPNRVLTAAHCTDGTPASYLSIRAGSTIRGQGGQVVAVAEIKQHKGYSSKTIDNDISILILAGNLKLGSAVQPIDIQNKNDEVEDGSTASVTGWGHTQPGGSSSTVLQYVEVFKISENGCKQAYGSSSITARMHCFGHPEGGRDSCQGDSGGPLVANNKQVGIVSWGIGCANARYPGVYTKVCDENIHDHITQHF